MLNKFHPLFLAGLLAVAAGCSKESAPTPTPTTAPQTANNVAPIDPGDGGGGGGGGGTGACVAPTETIKNSIKAYVVRQCRLNRWTIVTTITPPDGITYGLGCSGQYVFSVDVITSKGYATYASGTYDSGTGVYTLTAPNP